MTWAACEIYASAVQARSAADTAGVRALGRVPALDGLRGIAVMLVIAGHAWKEPAGAGFGVDIFFVLSGFLITSLLLNEHAASGRVSLGRFYVRRALRIAPALWLLIAVGAVLASTNAVAGAEAMSVRYSIRAAYLGNVGLGYSWIHGVPEEFGHFWSLAFEEQFYLVWPFLLVLLLRVRLAPRRIAFVLLLAALVSIQNQALIWAQGGSRARIWFAPDTHLAPLAIGCLAAVLFTYRLIPDRVIRRGWAPAAALCAMAIAVPPFDHRMIYDGPFAVFGFFCAAVVLAVACRLPLASRLFGGRALRSVGRVSYGLYLWHLPMIALFGAARGLPLAVAATLLSYRLVELPLLQLKERLRHGVVSGRQLGLAPAD